MTRLTQKDLEIAVPDNKCAALLTQYVSTHARVAVADAGEALLRLYGGSIEALLRLYEGFIKAHLLLRPYEGSIKALLRLY